MRKTISMVLLFAMLLSVAVIPAFAEASPSIYGDVDASGIVNSTDALLALQFAVSKITLSISKALILISPLYESSALEKIPRPNAGSKTVCRLLLPKTHLAIKSAISNGVKNCANFLRCSIETVAE